MSNLWLHVSTVHLKQVAIVIVALIIGLVYRFLLPCYKDENLLLKDKLLVSILISTVQTHNVSDYRLMLVIHD